MRHLSSPSSLLVLLLVCLSFRSFSQELSFSAYRNSPLQGLSSVILEEAYGYLNIPISVSPYVKKRDQITDGEVSQAEGLELNYPNLVRVKEPVNYSEETVFTKNKALIVEDWHSLSPHIIGIPLGSKYVEKHTQATQRILIPSYQQLFTMLEKNHFDLIISPRIEGLYMIRRTGFIDVKPLTHSLAKIDLYHYLDKKHEALVPQIETALRVMKENGRIEDLRQKFISRLKTL